MDKLDQWRHDLKVAARGFRRRALQKGLVVATLAFGLGPAVALYCVADSFLLRPFDYRDADELFWLWETFPQRDWDALLMSAPNFASVRDRSTSFSHLAAYQSTSFLLTGAEKPERVRALEVTPEFFPMLDVTPEHGRVLDHQDFGERPEVVMLTHAAASRLFGEASAAVGRDIRLDETPRKIVGTLPSGFEFPNAWGAYDLLIPYPLTSSALAETERDSRVLRVLGRLDTGIELAAAQAELSALGESLAQDHPESNAGHGFRLEPLSQHVGADLRPALIALAVSSAILLLVICANVANLVLAWTVERRQEVAIRVALGVRRWNLARQSLIETALLGVAGGVGGILVGWLTVRGLVLLQPPFMAASKLERLSLDWTALALGLTMALLIALLFGILPALRFSRMDVAPALRGGAGATSTTERHSRSRGALVVIQVALALVLVHLGFLLVTSFSGLRTIDLGFESRGVLTARVYLPQDERGEGAAWLWSRIVERVEAVPGVEASGGTSALPLSGSGGTRKFTLPTRPAPPAGEEPVAGFQRATPAYFEVLGIPLVRGRPFEAGDVTGSPDVALINETMAETYWPDADPLGQLLELQAAVHGSGSDRPSRLLTVVGVVGDVRHWNFEMEPWPEIFVPVAQEPPGSLYLVLETASGGAAGLGRQIEEAVAEISPRATVERIERMSSLERESLSGARFHTFLVSSFSAVGILIALMGIFGLVSYFVVTARQEIGIRVALGAERLAILRWLLGRVALLVAAGIGLGWLVAHSVRGFVEGLLFEVEPMDPLVFTLAVLCLSGAAAVASYLPARAALAVDPRTVLRAG